LDHGIQRQVKIRPRLRLEHQRVVGKNRAPAAVAPGLHDEFLAPEKAVVVALQSLEPLPFASHEAHDL
jgi:hypothetical protein